MSFDKESIKRRDWQSVFVFALVSRALVLLTLVSGATFGAACAGRVPPQSAQAAPRQKTAAAPAPDTDTEYTRLLRMARAYNVARQPNKAIDLSKRGIAIKERRPEAYAQLGLGLAALGDLSAAAIAYRSAFERGAKEREVFAQYTAVLEVSGRFDLAVDVYRKFLVEHPGDRPMRHELATALLGAGRPAAAIIELRRLLATNSGESNTHRIQNELGYALTKAGDFSGAIVTFDGLFGPTHGSFMDEAMLLDLVSGCGDPEFAIDLIDRYAKHPLSNRLARVRQRISDLNGAPASP